jgi:hypothetical protein
MLIGTDNSHFRKYLTTLGVSVIAGSLSLAGLFYNLQGDLLIEQETLAKLTPTARATIEQRQLYLSIAASAAPFVLLAMLLLGAAFCFIGLRGWATRQRTIDSREDLELKKLGVEVKKLTDEERAKALNDEVREATLNSRSYLGEQATASARSDLRSNILEAEALIFDKLKAHFGENRVLTQMAVRAGPQNRAMNLDAVVRPSGDDPGFVVEINTYLTRRTLKTG